MCQRAGVLRRHDNGRAVRRGCYPDARSRRSEPMTIKGSCHCKAHDVRGEPCTGKRDALHLLVLLQARRALGLLPAGRRENSVTTRRDAIYQWGSKTVKHNFCAACGCTTYTETPDWSTRQAGLRQPEDQHQCAAVRRFRPRQGRGGGDRRQEFVVIGERLANRESRMEGLASPVDEPRYSLFATSLWRLISAAARASRRG